MKALVARAYGPMEDLVITEVPAPAPGRGAMLVRTQAASLNGIDAKLITGELREYLPVEHPFVPGVDLAGVVEAVGDQVTGYAPGDRVLATTGAASGALAEYAVVQDSPRTALCPDTLDAPHAAALPLVALTSATLVDAAAVRAEETVLVVGASGGVGSVTVQLVRRTGARVLATGRDDEADWLRELGADEVIDYRAPATTTADEARRMTGGGVDVVLDTAVSGPELAASAAAARPGGRLLSVLGGPDAFDRGVTARYVGTDPRPGLLADLAAQAAEGRLRADIGVSYTFDDSRQALLDFASRHVRGKAVVTF